MKIRCPKCGTVLDVPPAPAESLVFESVNPPKPSPDRVVQCPNKTCREWVKVPPGR